MFNVGVLLAVVFGLAAVTAVVFYYGRLAQLRDASASQDADPAPSSPSAATPQRVQGEYDAVEITEAHSQGWAGESSQERVLGSYDSRAMAILRIEATRQKYRRLDATESRWFYVRATATGRPIWFADGIGHTRAGFDRNGIEAYDTGS